MFEDEGRNEDGTRTERKKYQTRWTISWKRDILRFNDIISTIENKTLYIWLGLIQGCFPGFISLYYFSRQRSSVLHTVLCQGADVFLHLLFTFPYYMRARKALQVLSSLWTRRTFNHWVFQLRTRLQTAISETSSLTPIAL